MSAELIPQARRVARVVHILHLPNGEEKIIPAPNEDLTVSFSENQGGVVIIHYEIRPPRIVQQTVYICAPHQKKRTPLKVNLTSFVLGLVFFLIFKDAILGPFWELAKIAHEIIRALWNLL